LEAHQGTAIINTNNLTINLTFCHSEKHEIYETIETNGIIEDLKELERVFRNYHRDTLSINLINLIILTPPLYENIENDWNSNNRQASQSLFDTSGKKGYVTALTMQMPHAVFLR